MKIAVPILTRGRPDGLVTVIKSLDILSSRKNQVKYVIQYDSDDGWTGNAIDLLELTSIDYEFVIKDRPLNLCIGANQVFQKAESSLNDDGTLFDADAYCVISDDVHPITPDWDEGVRSLIETRGLDFVAWNDACYPGNITHPIFSKKWVKSCKGKILPEWFSYWFADTWISQVYELARGEPVFIVTDMILWGKPAQHTNNMRNVKFWVDFWKETLPLRIKEAIDIRERMGWPEVNMVPVIEKFMRLDQAWDVAAMEATRGDPSPPDRRYLETKRRAEELLEQLPSIFPIWPSNDIVNEVSE